MCSGPHHTPFSCSDQFSPTWHLLVFSLCSQTPCCNKVYTCRFCHDENENHPVNRKDVTELVCTNCNTRQAVQAVCQKCNLTFGKVSELPSKSDIFINQHFVDGVVKSVLLKLKKNIPVKLKDFWLCVDFLSVRNFASNFTCINLTGKKLRSS